MKKSSQKIEASKKSTKSGDDREIQYNTYIKQVMKQLHPNHAITKEAMASMGDIVLAIIDLVAKRAGEQAID